ncbi:HVA1 family protein [Agrobacterium tumefaciens]|uniref:HVA1 family protein n=1 Tax=Agrobacterium tumefaciens TaxID=358 RepID=UPI001571EE84|nr:HVA1 family protein [Agrobacterium tumefaciens]
MSVYCKGTKVRWNWGSGTGEGKIVETFTDDVERTIAGSRIKRKASRQEPA